MVTQPVRRISILIVDDHSVVRQGVRAFLEAQADLAVVGEAESGTQAVQLAQKYLPVVVLMDLLLPGMNGVEADAPRQAGEPTLTSDRSRLVL